MYHNVYKTYQNACNTHLKHDFWLKPGKYTSNGHISLLANCIEFRPGSNGTPVNNNERKTPEPDKITIILETDFCFNGFIHHVNKLNINGLLLDQASGGGL